MHNQPLYQHIWSNISYNNHLWVVVSRSLHKVNTRPKESGVAKSVNSSGFYYQYFHCFILVALFHGVNEMLMLIIVIMIIQENIMGVGKYH